MVNLVEINQKELQEFWEWCGIRYEKDQDCFKVIFPDGEWYNFGHNWKMDKIEPEPDLNNLFKYAEKPLVDYFIKTTHTEEKYRLAYYSFLCEWLFDYIWNEPHNPALALYQAIQKARRKDK